MKTGQHLDALERARIEANATLRDMHECDHAVDSLISEVFPRPWTLHNNQQGACDSAAACRECEVREKEMVVVSVQDGV